MRLRSRAAMAAVALSLGGCASLHQPAEPAPPLAVPGDWSAPRPAVGAAEARTAAPARWWLRFGDPVLDAWVAEALQANTDIAVARARLRQARAVRLQTDAELAPSLRASGSAQSSWPDGRERSESWRAGLDASWELDLWGSGAASRRAAEATVEAGALTLAQAQVAVAAEVVLTWLQGRGAQLRLAIARTNLQSQRQTQQIVQWRVEAGLATALDLAQARTAVAQTAAQLPGLQASAQQAAHALAVLTGRAPGSLALPALGSGDETANASADRDIDADADAALPAAPPDLAGQALALPADVLRQRADVQAAERRIAAATARIEQIDAGRWPTLSLGGSVGLNALSLGALASSGAGVASLLASVSLPVFEGGTRLAQVRQQEAARDEAAAAWRATVLAALREVEDALVTLSATQDQLAAQRTALAAAREAATLASQRYGSGLVDFQNVLLAQRTRLAAEDAVASTRVALASAQVRLVKALGGGWPAPAPASEPPSMPAPVPAPVPTPTPEPAPAPAAAPASPT